jgi:hypothetical protein
MPYGPHLPSAKPMPQYTIGAPLCKRPEPFRTGRLLLLVGGIRGDHSQRNSGMAAAVRAAPSPARTAHSGRTASQDLPKDMTS